MDKSISVPKVTKITPNLRLFFAVLARMANTAIIATYVEAGQRNVVIPHDRALAHGMQRATRLSYVSFRESIGGKGQKMIGALMSWRFVVPASTKLLLSSRKN